LKPKRKTYKRAVTDKRNIPSRHRSFGEILIALKQAVPPSIKPRLKIFEPTTFPIEILDFPAIAALIVTANSGAEVPIATTVKPITRSETPKFRANREADSTRKSAPFHRRPIEKIEITTLTKIIW
jgi:hypothetical protein